jgi:hypothetical protein
MIQANFQEAIQLWTSSFDPVQTIFPDEKIKAVALGSLIHITSAANHLGLYSAFLACKASCLRFRVVLRLAVETTF